MTTEEILKQSAEKQALIAEQQHKHALDEQTRQRERAEKVQNNVVAIAARLQSALSYFVANEFPAVEKAGYDVKHNFRFSKIPTQMAQPYVRLELYMSRGGVVHMMGGEPPYKSDYQLFFVGDETDGTITAFFGTGERLAAPTSTSELSDSAVQEIFQSFLTRSMKHEEERIGSGPPPRPSGNRIGTPDEY
jgi:hypothetical protein